MYRAIVSLICLLVMCDSVVAEEGPSAVVARTYSWVYTLLPQQTFRLSDGQVISSRLSGPDKQKAWKSFRKHAFDFAPELRSLLKAVDQMEQECRSGKRKMMCWDNDPFTWSEDEELVGPLSIIEKQRSGAAAMVTVSTTGYYRGRAASPTRVLQWEVDLIQSGGRWQINNLRFPGGNALQKLGAVEELRTMAQEYR